MLETKKIIDYLREYKGPTLKIMEVCGTHTAAIFKNGIRTLISPRINLISGPGCPVCVTPTAYIDKVIGLARKEKYHIFTFGDMMKVPGSNGSLSDFKGSEAKIHMLYSPFEALKFAENNPEEKVLMAAVGFETTAPSYGLMLAKAKEKNIKNIKVLSSLKTVEPALDWICKNHGDIDGFLCPGHVSVIIGTKPYEALAKKYNKPFVVAGFQGEHILAAIYDIVKQYENGHSRVDNLYKSLVKRGGNTQAQEVLEQTFIKGRATWRGLGNIENSGLYLNVKFQDYDAGSMGLDKDKELSKECKCAQVITGKINPNQCTMFGTKCTPLNPYGPCMVSPEGSCGIWYQNQT